MRDELLQDPILSMDRIANGMIKVPDGPGLGIELNESALERFRTSAARPMLRCSLTMNRRGYAKSVER
jgi:L-alanine-DL-glutamate epimerase-like enolase superfamily enzyme